MNKIKIYWDIISPVIKILLIGLGMFFVIGLVLSIPLCLLWNWLMPIIFNLPNITIPQAFGLSILITLLSPKNLDFSKKKAAVQPTADVELNKKLAKSLDDITSQFKN